MDHNQQVIPETDITSFFDRFDVLLDSPIPYLTNVLLATHARTQVCAAPGGALPSGSRRG